MKAQEEQSEELVYRHCLPIQIRFNDVDQYGHVNNNSYFSYYDLGKEDYLRSVMKVDYRKFNVVPVIANINCDFLLPIFYGDPVQVETCVSHIGQRSFTLTQRIVNERSGVVMSRCATVMVCFSLVDQASADMPEHYREAIKRFELGETSL